MLDGDGGLGLKWKQGSPDFESIGTFKGETRLFFMSGPGCMDRDKEMAEKDWYPYIRLPNLLTCSNSTTSTCFPYNNNLYPVLDPSCPSHSPPASHFLYSSIGSDCLFYIPLRFLSVVKNETALQPETVVFPSPSSVPFSPVLSASQV